MNTPGHNETQATLRHKAFLFALYALSYSVFYILPNLHPQFPPVTLPFMQVDRWVPFLPWTFIVYLSAYGLALYIILILKDLESFNAFCRRMFAGLFFCGAFFLLLPTTYPRPPYPEANSKIVQFFMWLVQAADTPNNCFPSMHVAMTTISVLSLRGVSRSVAAFCSLWAVAIFASTLTTKQHYFVDILGGAAVALTVSYFHYLLYERNLFRRLAGR